MQLHWLAWLDNGRACGRSIRSYDYYVFVLSVALCLALELTRLGSEPFSSSGSSSLLLPRNIGAGILSSLKRQLCFFVALAQVSLVFNTRVDRRENFGLLCIVHMRIRRLLNRRYLMQIWEHHWRDEIIFVGRGARLVEASRHVLFILMRL